MKTITAINLKCGKYNQVIDVANFTNEEIEELIKKYDKTRWLIIKSRD